MGSTRIMMPLLHKEVEAFKDSAWYLGSGVYLDTIYDEDYGAFQRDDHLDDYYKTSLSIHTTCLYITEPQFDDMGVFTRAIATRVKFVLNNFSAGTPVVFPYAALIEVGNKARLAQIADIEAVANLHAFRQRTYKLRPASDKETISDYYKLVSKCCHENPTVLFPLERFNSSLTRPDWLDKIVDITISLESLIAGTQELTYKFALYNAFVAETEPDARRNAFDLLHILYIARSRIVHGDTSFEERAFEKVTNNWESILRLARGALNYYLMFLHERNRAEWDQHLKNLVFGLETRIVE